MPWCPKCELEYVAGKTVCVECGTELIDELSKAPKLVSFMETEKEKLARKLVEFLHYSKIESATYEYNEEKKIWEVLIKEDSQKQVKKLYDAFYKVEMEQKLSSLKNRAEDDGMSDYSEETAPSHLDTKSTAVNTSSVDDDLLENEVYEDDLSNEEDDSLFNQEEIQAIFGSSKKAPSKNNVYVKKEEQYKDLYSSALTFIIVSLLGILVLLLNAVGIIQVFYGIMPYIVMGLLFIGFIYVGITSYIKSQKVKSEIAEENSVTDAINAWLAQNVTLEKLDSLTSIESNEEIRFFHKLEKMKELINEKFGELDDLYLDSIVEEFYNNNFDTNS